MKPPFHLQIDHASRCFWFSLQKSLFSVSRWASTAGFIFLMAGIMKWTQQPMMLPIVWWKTKASRSGTCFRCHPGEAATWTLKRTTARPLHSTHSLPKPRHSWHLARRWCHGLSLSFQAVSITEIYCAKGQSTPSPVYWSFFNKIIHVLNPLYFADYKQHFFLYKL